MKKGQAKPKAANLKKTPDVKGKKAQAGGESARNAEACAQSQQPMSKRRSMQNHQAKLKRKPGKLITEAEMSLVLYAYYYFRVDHDLAHEKALSHVSESHGISRSILSEAVDLWESKKIVRVKDGSQRALGGKGRTKAPPGTAERLQRRVRELTDAGRSATAKELQAWLASPPGEGHDAEREPVKVSLQTVRNWLHSMVYGNTEPNAGSEPEAPASAPEGSDQPL